MKSMSDVCRTVVFISKIPESIEIKTVIPPERDAEIAETSNNRLKVEKYFVWRLLEHALFKSFGINIEDVEFVKSESGRWTSLSFDFSLSHSGGVAAVAISNTSVGIDIELINLPKSENFAKRILSKSEYDEFSLISDDKREEYLIKKWTQKEAAFKSKNLSNFIPNKTEPDEACFIKTEMFIINGKKHFCSVVTAEKRKIEFFVVDCVN